MIEINLLYEDIRKGIEKYFSFLKEYHFSDFTETDFGLSYHFECTNGDSNIDICVEAMSYTPIHLQINKHSITLLEPENDFQKQYAEKAEEYYITYEQHYKKNKISFSETQSSQYKLLLKELNEEYLQEAALILKRNKNVLSGNNSLLEINLAIAMKKWKMEDETRKNHDKIYSCEFKFGSGIESSYEAKSVAEIKKYLKELDDNSIRDIEVYDWNMQKIDFLLDW